MCCTVAWLQYPFGDRLCRFRVRALILDVESSLVLQPWLIWLVGLCSQELLEKGQEKIPK